MDVELSYKDELDMASDAFYKASQHDDDWTAKLMAIKAYYEAVDRYLEYKKKELMS